MSSGSASIIGRTMRPRPRPSRSQRLRQRRRRIRLTQRRDGAELGRSGAGVPAVRDARPHFRTAARRSWRAAGSFIESFPLFGYNLEDYDQLFEEKLDLLLAIRDSEQRHLDGRDARADPWARRLPATAAGSAADLDRGRRHAAIGGAGRGARPAAGARHHRRRSRAGLPRSSISIARPPAAPARIWPS